jgi:BirA family biotin operon repressor/biotin-[acetyl-CoA-carboxylase] ligase
VTSPDSAHRDDLSGDPRHWRDDLLQAALDAAGDGSWGPVAVLGSTGSTNADAADQVREGAPEGFTIVAEEQTLGRGRLDRSWHSPSGAGLAMSVVLRPISPESSWGWVPLLSGLAVVEALEAQGVTCALKWPNDVVVDGDARDGSAGPRKLGGILVERVERALVVGIGVNVDLRAVEVPVARATSTFLEGVHVGRERLVVDVLVALRRHYLRWQLASGDARRSGLADAYTGRCITLGREVRALLPGDRVEEGRAYALDDEGRLLLRRPDGGTHPVSAGDIEHLR